MATHRETLKAAVMAAIDALAREASGTPEQWHADFADISNHVDDHMRKLGRVPDTARVNYGPRCGHSDAQ